MSNPEEAPKYEDSGYGGDDFDYAPTPVDAALESVFDVPADQRDAKAVQRAYAAAIERGQVSLIIAIEAATNIPPDPVFIQKTYEKDILSGFVNDANHLFILTGIKPEISYEVAQAGFKALFTRGYISGFSNLTKLSGVTPRPEDVQEWHRTAFKQASPYIMQQLRDVTGISPDIDAETAQQGYARFLLGKDGDNSFPSMRKICDIAPDPARVRQAYATLVRLGRIYKLEEDVKATNIGAGPFSDDDVQQGYLTLFREPGTGVRMVDTFAIQQLRNLTGIAPDPKMVRGALARWVREGHARNVTAIANFTGQKPEFTAADVRTGYTHLMRDPNPGGRYADFRRLTGKDAEPQVVRKAYAELLKKGAVGPLLVLFSNTGFKMEAADPEKIRQMQDRFVKMNDLPAVSLLRKMTDVPPSQEVVQKKYEEHMAAGLLNHLSILKQATGIAPRYDETAVRSCYARYIQSGSLHALDELSKMSGIPIDPEIIQLIYQKHISDGNNVEVKDLKTRTGIEPVIRPEDVQRGYRHLVDVYGSSYDIGFEGFRAQTGQLPDAETARICYNILLANANVQGIESLKQITGIDPAFDSDQIRRAVSRSLQEYNYTSYAKLLKMTGRGPDSEVINEQYLNLFSRYAWDRVGQLKTATGIGPDEKSVQGYYRRMFSGGMSSTHDIKRLWQVTGIAPDPMTIMMRCQELLQRGHIYDLDELVKAFDFPLKTDSLLIQTGYAALLARNDMSGIAALKELTGMDMPPESVAQALKQAWVNYPASVPEILLAFPDMIIDWSAVDPQMDFAMYSSAMRIPNKDLFRKAWTFLAEHDRQQKPAAKEGPSTTPPHVTGMLRLAGFDGGPQLSAKLETVFANAASRKKGAGDLARQAEFAVINLATGRLGDAATIRGLFENIITPATTPEDVVAILDAIATLKSLDGSMNAVSLETSGSSSKAIDMAPLASMKTPEEALAWIRTAQRELMEKILGYGPTAEEFKRVETEWGTLRPLFILGVKYQAGYRDGLPLFSRASRAIFQGTMREFRYEEPEAMKMLDGLAPEQRRKWIEPMEKLPIEEIGVSEAKAETLGAAVRERIVAGLDQGYLYSAQHPETAPAYDAYVWTRGILKQDGGFDKASLGEAKTLVGLELYRRTRLASVLKELRFEDGPETVDPAELLKRAEGSAETLRKSLAVKPSAKNESALGRMESAVYWAQEMLRLQPDADRLRALLGLKEEIELKRLGAIREQLQLADDLVGLATLSPEEIRGNALRGAKGELRRGELPKWIDRIHDSLKKSGSAFAGTLEDVRETLSAERRKTTLSGLVMEETDHPKAMVEMGKYPTGATSCQNYEGDVGYNRDLIAMLSDPDKKLLLVRKPDGTIVARVTVKLCWLPNGDPAIFIAPTYNSSTVTVDFKPIVDAYLREKAARMGGIKVMRGGMDEGLRVTVRASRNRYQYEDGATGGPNTAGLGEQDGSYTMEAVEIPAV